MTDYRKYINALRQCAKEHENDQTFTGHIIVSDLCRDTANLLEEVEQEPKEGHWISETVENEDWKGFKRQYYQPISCSICHSPNYNKSSYCPNCGSKMDVRKEE